MIFLLLFLILDKIFYLTEHTDRFLADYEKIEIQSSSDSADD